MNNRIDFKVERHGASFTETGLKIRIIEKLSRRIIIPFNEKRDNIPLVITNFITNITVILIDTFRYFYQLIKIRETCYNKCISTSVDGRSAEGRKARDKNLPTRSHTRHHAGMFSSHYYERSCRPECRIGDKEIV